MERESCRPQQLHVLLISSGHSMLQATSTLWYMQVARNTTKLVSQLEVMITSLCLPPARTVRTLLSSLNSCKSLRIVMDKFYSQ